MKTLITAIAALCLALSVNAQCPQSTSTTFDIAAITNTVVAGQPLSLFPRSGGTFPKVSMQRMQAQIDGVPTAILNANDAVITISTPVTIVAGTHTVAICIADGPYGLTDFAMTVYRDTLDTDIDKTDPDPTTQNGGRKDLSDAGRRPTDFPVTTYPNGGHGGTLSCVDRHRIDGTFTRLSDGSREWSGIAPMVGRFSHLYLDYCSERRIMYLMNDWLIGSSSYETNCYNLFDFTTGNGTEHWRIKVTHDSANPVIVELNGVDVTTDSTLVIGGGYGFGPSPSDTVPHTIYEFGVVVAAGLFIIPTGSDPVQYVPSTRTSLECDANGVEGYGLIREPTIRTAVFAQDGIITQQYERYIPQGGVVGLEKEPNDISGHMSETTITYRSGSQQPVTNRCAGVGEIDGAFTPEEWAGANPASGMFSDLYAQYCRGELHILNDWIYATQMPNNASCYNLFELFTGDGREHWGIWVWQDPSRRPTVIRNGVDVSADTTIVEAGKAGWGSSARKAEPHAIYEFKIRTMEGGFALQYADPGPASFCSLTANGKDESVQPTGPQLRPSVLERTADVVTITNVLAGTTIHMMDLQGRIVASDRVTQGGEHILHLPATLSSGRYTVRLTHSSGISYLPLLIMM
ncbi:MAG: hypothetical protein FGM24_09910 [Candidatus Kapabacteria bacterium]|nr:hypothetical protein [Candidatus Kapabacteria bacterium]